MERSCVIPSDSDERLCGRPVDTAAPLALCTWHLLEAYDWVVRDVGVTDLLPLPCAACGGAVGIRYPSGWMCAECEWRVGDMPDADLGRIQIEVVYYIRYGQRVKIGTSANPRRRIRSLPHDEVLAFERGGRALEQRRHAQFAEHRINGGEWFTENAALADHIGELSIGVDDPWKAYERWLVRRLALEV